MIRTLLKEYMYPAVTLFDCIVRMLAALQNDVWAAANGKELHRRARSRGKQPLVPPNLYNAVNPSPIIHTDIFVASSMHVFTVTELQLKCECD